MSGEDKERGVGGAIASPDTNAAANVFRPETTFSAPAADNIAPSITPNVGLPTLSAPKGGGAIRSIGEKFSANAATGTVSLSVPIATSPGRGGFDLGLALSYDSGAGNGPFGVGWQIGVPAITRKTDKGIPRYLDDAESDTFILSGAEDLVSVPGELTRGEFRVVRYRPRVEQAFSRIERWTHRSTGEVHWRTTTGANITSIFGRSREARIADPEDPRRVFSWLLEEARDDRGNIVRYTYKVEDAAGIDVGAASEAARFADGGFRATAQRYLKRIEYGNRIPGDTSAWLFEVVFDYGEHDEAAPTPVDARPWPVRLDAFSTYRAGFEIRTYRLCRRALMFHRFEELGPEPYLVRSTDLGYQHRDHLSALVQVTQAGYLRDEQIGGYERATLPPLDLAYTERRIHGEVRAVEPDALDGIPGGVDGAAARWVDLDGEGISGVLLARDRGWYYKANLGQGHLAPPALLRSLPVPAALTSGVQQLTDLAGEGQLDLVQYEPPLPGYFTRTAEGGWSPFTPFRELPRIDWRDPNLRFLDVDGDGLADVLVTEDNALVWYRSRGKAGFEPPEVLSRPRDEDRGAAVVFHDGTETIQLADMSGDGLVDIVRVRNGELCYWPNLGHGRFGRKVTMDRSPWFAEPDQFDPRSVRLADLDGSGTADVIYLGHDGVRLWFNESGNRLSAPTTLDLPLPHSASSIAVVDLLGSGTACLVWSSPLAADGTRPLAYVDLMGGAKPHLLARYTNGFGGETRFAYASSTAFYLRDKAEGRPWLTRLSFPVQLLERAERYDHVAGTRLVTRYRYHHGFYDGVEREYRGFAFVEQWDAETIGGGVGKGLFSEMPDEVDGELRLPPVCTRTWFHTGAWLDRERIELALAREYYPADREAPRLVRPPLPRELSIAEQREAARALRGRMLRQEIYAEDGLPESVHPYSVTEHTFGVRLLQRAQPRLHGEGHAHAVFLVHPREDLALHYERRPDDPRAQHQLMLEVDDFGNVLRSAAIAYPRRKPLHPEQARLWATVSEASFANRSDEDSWYRIGVPIESATSELTGLPIGRVFTVETMRGLIAEAAEIPFEATPSGQLARRLLSRRYGLYYSDDLRGPLPRGRVESRALPYETYEQAFTPGLVAGVYGNSVGDDLLAAEARYLNADGAWWVSSGKRIFAPAAFYQPVEAIDPFGERFHVRYDARALLVVETEDAIGNKVTAANDYRVLAPRLVTDANLNRTAAVFDALGMPIRIALMGKPGAGEGDTLEDPTIRVEYDLHRYAATGGAQPVLVHTFARENHGAENPRWQESYSYRDGSVREAMRKVQAPPGDVPVRGPDGRLRRDEQGAISTSRSRHRWIGTGRTVFDNKNNAVKKYEPFFSDTFEYETERALVEWGVTPILRYDPIGRLIRTDLPDGTLRRVAQHAWENQTWDENDTALESRWYQDRGAPDPRGPEPKGDPGRRAAWLAAQHANTPSRAHVDSLGRAFLQEADNRDPAGPYRTRIEFDVSGNRLAVVDPRGIRVVDAQSFDMLGRQLFTRSADAGWSRILPDVVGKTVRGWDARGHALRYRYDALRRPTHVFVAAARTAEILVARHVYGEEHPDAVPRNLRTRTYRTYDGAGIATNERFDLQGNLLVASRVLAREYKRAVDWSAFDDRDSMALIDAASDPRVTGEVFTTVVKYDALGRMTSRVTPDGSDARPHYNETSLLDRLDIAVRGGQQSTFIQSIEYDARGQRTRIVRGNGTATSYQHDPKTFRLRHLHTTRREGERLQDLRYEYDAVGNVTQLRDGVSFGNEAVPADGRYAYDPLYRLTCAEGREHPGQQPSSTDAELLDLGHPHDLQAIRRYREAYTYDPAGNIARVAHHPLGGAGSGWVRRYEYSAENNRLLHTGGPGDDGIGLSERYTYDAHGNMTAMPHLHEMRWDYADHLISVDRGGGGDVHFTYDASGQRVRKIYEHGGSVEERIYLGGYEIYRKHRTGEATPALERQTLHVMDDGRRVAMLETKTIDAKAAVATETTRTRYELDDVLGSAVMEVDDQGLVISYEEYLPYGATAFRASRKASEPSAKRYRYTGQERDDETGLYYHGARYYAAWLGRWTAPDPAGTADGFNPYQYVHDNPIRMTDPTGRISWGVVAAVVAVVVVVAVITVVTVGAGTGPAAAGGAALLAGGAEAAAVGTTAAVVGTEAAVGTAAVVGTEVAVGTVAAVGTEAAVGTAAVVGTEAAVGTVAAVTTETAVATTAAVTTEAAVTTTAAVTTEAAAGSTAATSITAAQVTSAGTAVTTVAGAAQTPAGQQLIQEGEEVLASVGPAIGGEAQVIASEVQSLAPRLSSIAPQVEATAERLGGSPIARAAESGVEQLEGSAGETVDLFRAVGVREYQAVMQSGGFYPGANSLEGRQFAFTLQEALKYADTDTSKVAVLKAIIRGDVLSAFDFSRSIDPHIFTNGVVTVQPGEQSELFHAALLAIEHVF